MTFQPQKDQKAAKLVYKGSKSVNVEIPFSLKDVKLLELRLTSDSLRRRGDPSRIAPAVYFSSLIRHVKIGRDAGNEVTLMRNRFVLLAAFGLALSRPGQDEKDLARLVSRLGSRRFHEREAAMATLAQQRTPAAVRGSAPGNAALRSRNPQASAGPSQRS